MAFDNSVMTMKYVLLELQAPHPMEKFIVLLNFLTVYHRFKFS